MYILRQYKINGLLLVGLCLIACKKDTSGLAVSGRTTDVYKGVDSLYQAYYSFDSIGATPKFIIWDTAKIRTIAVIYLPDSFNYLIIDGDYYKLDDNNIYTDSHSSNGGSYDLEITYTEDSVTYTAFVYSGIDDGNRYHSFRGKRFK